MSLTRVFTSSAPWVIGREALFADATEDFLHEMTRQRPWLRVRYEMLLGELNEALDIELQQPAPLTALTLARGQVWLQQVDIAQRPLAESALNAFADYLVKWGSERAGDLGPEGLAFIAASESPIGEPLLVVANEVSGSTIIFRIRPQ